MGNRPAAITQADVARIIRAAKRSGATEVEVRVRGGCAIVRLPQSTDEPAKPLEPEREIVL